MANEPKICPYGDPGCPCQDGDACHYETYTWDTPSTAAMKPPRLFLLAKIVAEELTDNGHPVSSPDEGDQDDVERARWMVCLRIADRLAVEAVADRVEPSAGILTRLRHAITTASNDDTSPPGTTLRRRHSERIAAMGEAVGEIERLVALLDGTEKETT